MEPEIAGWLEEGDAGALEMNLKRGLNWLINKLSVNNAYFSRIPTPAVLRAITSSKYQPKE